MEVEPGTTGETMPKAMTPPGPERNREIAELRGGELADPMSKCIARQLDRCPAEPLDDDCPDNCSFLKDNHKPYSTDIAAAMELKLPGAHYEIKMDRSPDECWTASMRVYFYPHVIEFKSDCHRTEAAAIADARTGAWLKWKTNGN